MVAIDFLPETLFLGRVSNEKAFLTAEHLESAKPIIYTQPIILVGEWRY